MILGRPTNLWLGLVSGLIGFLQVAIIALKPDVDATQLGLVLGAAGLFLGAVIALVANQAPTIQPGSTVNVVTPAGEANRVVTVA